MTQYSNTLNASLLTLDCFVKSVCVRVEDKMITGHLKGDADAFQPCERDDGWWLCHTSHTNWFFTRGHGHELA